MDTKDHYDPSLLMAPVRKMTFLCTKYVPLKMLRTSYVHIIYCTSHGHYLMFTENCENSLYIFRCTLLYISYVLLLTGCTMPFERKMFLLSQNGHKVNFNYISSPLFTFVLDT